MKKILFILTVVMIFCVTNVFAGSDSHSHSPAHSTAATYDSWYARAAGGSKQALYVTGSNSSTCGFSLSVNGYGLGTDHGYNLVTQSGYRFYTTGTTWYNSSKSNITGYNENISSCAYGGASYLRQLRPYGYTNWN